MIEFKDLPIRDTASIMKGQFEQVKMLYKENPQLAGELAISMMEQALCLDYSSTDFTVQLVLKNYEKIMAKNAEKYDTKKFTAIEAKKDTLRPIADRLRAGMTQAQISKELKIPTSTLSDKVKKIRAQFPELLEIPPDPDFTISDGPDSDGIFRNPNEIAGNPEKNPDLEQNPENPVFPENPVHVNVNVNVNDNVTPNSSYEEIVGTISLEELNRMGARFTYVTDTVVEIEGTKKRFQLLDNIINQF